MSTAPHEEPSRVAAYVGRVRGSNIELDGITNLVDGQIVIVTVNPVEDPSKVEGIRQSFGSAANDSPELDAWLADVYAARQAEAGR
jgi:ribosomal protein L10